ncbi:hypothetical protein CAOG_007282 [Capsaspora owczarzaki ATCC 30864]|uniref:Glycosyl transferase family 1 domain-containing protein n=1 Tax=Capsaspora owczarzaki (strain ATCC 30864) TaxID=595528 RepID=A0A0D2WWP1_CAPO3|nr:hypothetical protein CAOG_007282 [Capsaspora owczarzaki ATCC 30864]
MATLTRAYRHASPSRSRLGSWTHWILRPSAPVRSRRGRVVLIALSFFCLLAYHLLLSEAPDWHQQLNAASETTEPSSQPEQAALVLSNKFSETMAPEAEIELDPTRVVLRVEMEEIVDTNDKEPILQDGLLSDDTASLVIEEPSTEMELEFKPEPVAPPSIPELLAAVEEWQESAPWLQDVNQTLPEWLQSSRLQGSSPGDNQAVDPNPPLFRRKPITAGPREATPMPTTCPPWESFRLKQHRTQVLLYAPVNVNWIDGSSAWLVSLATVLVTAPNCDVHVDILLQNPLVTTHTSQNALKAHKPVQGSFVDTAPMGLYMDEKALVSTAPVAATLQPLLSQGRVRLLDAWNPAHLGDQAVTAKVQRLSPALAVRAIRALDAREEYNLILVRGLDVGQLLAREPNMARRTSVVFVSDIKEEQVAQLREIVQSPARLVFSTPHMREFSEENYGVPHGSVVIPPMVPDPSVAMTSRADLQSTDRPLKFCYSGKADSLYMSLELVAGFQEFLRQNPTTQVSMLLMVSKVKGDAAFQQQLSDRMDAAAPHIEVRSGLVRTEVARILRTECDVGLRWMRHDSGHELSTKLIEYAANGLPVLVNRSPATESFLGVDYPFFLTVDGGPILTDPLPEGQVEFSEIDVQTLSVAMGQMVANRHLLAEISAHVRKRAEPFFFSSVATTVFGMVNPYRSQNPVALSAPEAPTLLHRRIRVLFAGFQMKFASQIIKQFRARSDVEVELDMWKSHTGHNETRSKELAEWADVVWCEWALGNAVWYADNLALHKTLVVRLHRQELVTKFIHTVNWSRVDRLLVITPWIYASAKQWLPANATVQVELVYNSVDTESFLRPKTDQAFRTLGLLGYVPLMKRVDLAVEILVELRQTDSTWKLMVAGESPFAYDWIIKRTEELNFYYNLAENITQLELESAVQYLTLPVSPPEWFENVGYILSTSDYEGSHQAVAEGMAAGSIPVVRNWNGSELIYPTALHFNTPKEAAQQILQMDASFMAVEGAKRARLIASTVTPYLEEANNRFALQRCVHAAFGMMLPPGVPTVVASETEWQANFGLEMIKATPTLRQPIAPLNPLKVNIAVWMSLELKSAIASYSQVVPLNSTSWRELFKNVQFDLLLVAADDLEDPLEAFGADISELVLMAHDMHVPFVFWDARASAESLLPTVQPHQKTLEMASAVFVTTKLLEAEYATLLKASEVPVHRAWHPIQHLVHNPTGSRRPKLGKSVFFGPDASLQEYPSSTTALLAPAVEHGLVIFGDATAVVPKELVTALHPLPLQQETNSTLRQFQTGLVVGQQSHQHLSQAVHAVMAGTAIIADSASVDELRQVLGSNGFVEADSADAVSDALKRLSSSAQREALTLNAQRHILASRTYQHFLGEILQAASIYTEAQFATASATSGVSVVACMEHNGATAEQDSSSLPLVPLVEDDLLDDILECPFPELEAHVESYLRMEHAQKELVIGVYGRQIFPLSEHAQARVEATLNGDASVAADLSLGLRDLSEMVGGTIERVPVCSPQRLYRAGAVERILAHRYPSLARVVFETRDWGSGLCMNQAVVVSGKQPSPMPLMLFLESGHYYGRNFLTDLVPIFGFTDAKIVGKSSVHVPLPSDVAEDLSAKASPDSPLSAGLFHRQPEAENEFVDVITASATAIVQRELFQSQLSFSITSSRPLERLLLEARNQRIVMYSGNRHGFVHVPTDQSGYEATQVSAAMRKFVDV